MAGKTQLTLEESSEAIVTKGGLQVTFNAAGGVEVTVNGKNIVVDQTGKVAVEATNPANDSLVQKVLEVGDRLKDGTVCIAVDLNKNKALFAPAGIFGGKSDFDHQDGVVNKANAQSLHGHNDWRRITDDEGKTLSEVWDKVAPEELKGRAAPWFWLASPGNLYGRVRRGGVADWLVINRFDSLPVPVVRGGPARI